MPLPPYIHEKLDQPECGIKLFLLRRPGSAAAPTAGLHFTPTLINQLKNARDKFYFGNVTCGIRHFRPCK